MDDQIFDQGLLFKKRLRKLAKVLQDPVLEKAADYIDQLEVMLVTSEGTIDAYATRGLQKPVGEILKDFAKQDTVSLEIRPALPIPRPELDLSLVPLEIRHLGLKILAAFNTLVREAHEWGGSPCVGTSDAGPSLRGALPHLKRAGLLTTYVKQDGSMRGSGTYVLFTDLGSCMANEIEILNGPIASTTLTVVQSCVGSESAQFRSEGPSPPSNAVLVTALEWTGGPAHSPCEKYWLYRDEANSAWFITLSTDGVEGEYLYANGGWLEPSQSVMPKDAAAQILLKIWKDEENLGEFRGPLLRVIQSGLLSENDVTAIALEIRGGA